MNEFRQALDAHAEGRIELGAIERHLTLALAKQPHLAAAHGALVEAVYRSGRIPGASYLALINAIRAFQQSRPRVETSPPKLPASAVGDQTQFRAPKSAPQAAEASPAKADGDATQFRAPRAVRREAAAAGATDTSDVRVATDSRPPTGSRPTSSGWTDLGRSVAEGPPLRTGSVVKERFVLEEELGRGGMGVVYKARDLRKEEAQDRNPWVALKLLNEEFRRHPESLKALQRESRKAQHLAHANVVTVYDFDRDGGNVFMVMELLEGQSLDRIIRDHEETGVGKERALRLTRDLCRAMAYAHEQGVVHSDFKPANAFVTKDNVVKVFDFGIARAAKRADNVSGSTTLFDPGTLGALTPTYASCEMIEGLEPDPRDDVYAIACVAYELFAGKHPFNRVSAVEARNNRMVAKRPRGLRRQQWRALQHGLMFNRENRTASARQFLDEMVPRKTRPTVSIAIAAGVTIALVIAGFMVPGFLEKRRERALIDSLTTADAQRLDALIQELRALTPEQRAAVLLSDVARSGLIKAFEGRIDAATDANQSSPDYPAARTLLRELQALLPDSLAVKDLEDRLAARENDEIKRLSDRFDQHLAAGLLIDAQGAQNVGTVLASLRKIDPQNRLLNDPRLPGAFAAQTSKALQASDPVLAQALVAAGLGFDTRDATLADLRDQVQRAVIAREGLARRDSLEGSLAALAGAQVALADIDGKRAELDELRSIAPDSAVLAEIQQRVQDGVSAQAVQLVSAGQHGEALDLIARYADVLPVSFVDAQRAQLATASGAADARRAAVEQSRNRIDTLLQGQTADDAWGTQLDREMRQLAAYVPATDPYFAQIKTRAAGRYLDQARALRGSQRLTEAERMVERARAYVPQSADLAAELKLLADARSTQEAAAQQRNRLAQIDALKNKLLVQARANEVNEALASLQELRPILNANDDYIAAQAPAAIGAAYLRLASTAARDGRFENAVTLTTRAQEIAPSLRDAAPARERYSRYQGIDQMLKTGGTIDGGALRDELDRLGRHDVGESAAVKERLARSLVARIRASDAATAKRLTAVAQQMFAEQSAVKSLLEGEQPDDAASTTRLPSPVATPMITVSSEPSAEGGSDDAGAAVAASPSSAASRPSASGNTRVAVVRPSPPVGEQVEGPRAPPDIPCSDRLAGYGKRRQAVCYDTFSGGGRGPDLVVIPAGGESKAFAFGRTEVSNADYAAYCTRTGRCTPPQSQPEYPVTGLSLDDARAYLAWLSQVTGVAYRLPTDGEWTFAVTAQGGNADTSSVNCLVEIGGKRVRGVALEPVQSGASNGWGLFNSLGNAQEWVVSGAAVSVRGGAFSDNISACTPESKRPHAGGGDSVTGLRVLRELS